MFNFGILDVGHINQLLADKWFDSIIITLDGDNCCHYHLGVRRQFVRNTAKQNWRMV